MRDYYDKKLFTGVLFNHVWFGVRRIMASRNPANQFIRAIGKSEALLLVTTKYAAITPTNRLSVLFHTPGLNQPIAFQRDTNVDCDLSDAAGF